MIRNSLVLSLVLLFTSSTQDVNGVDAVVKPVPRADSLLTLPGEVVGDEGMFIVVNATTNCSVVRWYVIDPGLSLLPPELLKDTKTAIVSGKKGRYRLLAYTAIGDTPSAPSITTVIVGNAPPAPVPPGPGPVPPGPTPPPSPAKQLRVILVYESSANMTKDQMTALYSPKVVEYLNAKTVKDGTATGWRRWDKDVSSENEKEPWKRIWAATKPNIKTVPAVVILDGDNGTVLPFPENEASLLALLKQYGGV